MKVELIEKFKMTIGTVLVIKSPDVLKIGDSITDGVDVYTIKNFMQPTGAYDENVISILV